MTQHGICHETKNANRVNGPMFWESAEIAALGPIVRIRELHSDGTRGRWETIAIALDPTSYVRTVRGSNDVTISATA